MERVAESWSSTEKKESTSYENPTGTPSSGTYGTEATAAVEEISAVEGGGGGWLKSLVPVGKRPSGKATLIVLRGAERVDRVFPGWTGKGFAADGAWQPYDLNLPRALPRRAGGAMAFVDDTPLTRLGEWTASRMGLAMAQRRLRPQLLLASPALRSVQTASSILKAFPASEGPLPQIHLEPGLFEPLGWYSALPEHLSPEAMAALGYPVSLAYKSVIPSLSIAAVGRETEEGARRRIQAVMQRIISAVEAQMGMEKEPLILVVAHAFTLDALCRWSQPTPPPAPIPSPYLGLAYPYLSHLSFVPVTHNRPQTWTLHNQRPHILPSIHHAYFSSVATPLLNV